MKTTMIVGLCAAFGITAGCELAQPFSVAAEPEGEFIAAATHLRMSEGGDGALFDEHVNNIVTSLEDTPGYLGHSLRTVVGGRDNWTLTAWESEEAMVSFMLGEIHSAAMADAGEFDDGTGNTTHWTLAADAFPPTWEDADSRLGE